MSGCLSLTESAYARGPVNSHIGRMPRVRLLSVEMRSVQQFGMKVWRHARWARSEGIARLVEEDQLYPIRRTRLAFEKSRWQHRYGASPGNASAAFIVGLQRSGTNMLTRGIDLAPEVEVHNENDRRYFQSYLLRSDDLVESAVQRSRAAVVLFKPLCDSHRTATLLDRFNGRGRAIWVYRDVAGRTRSALSKFGDHNLRVLRQIAAGEGAGLWQAGGLDDGDLALVKSFDWTTMPPESAAAVFWYLRNNLVFRQGLHERDDVLLLSYNDFLSRPEQVMRSVCDHLDLAYRSSFIEDVEPSRNQGCRPLDLDPRVADLCEQMWQRLTSASHAAPRT